RREQAEAASALIDSEAELATRLADLENELTELQDKRDHSRWQANQQREFAHMNAAYDLEIAVMHKETVLAQAREQLVRAKRNCEAAQRVKDVEVDRWYLEAQARTNNARAEHADTVADLHRSPAPTKAPADADRSREELLAKIDHEIELAKTR